MPFSDTTLRWAETIKVRVEGLAASDKSLEELTQGAFAPSEPLSGKKRLAGLLYFGLRHRYGFKHELETDDWTPDPDSLESVNCFTQSVANYVVARECGLEPRVVEFVGFQQEGRTARAGHSLVTINVGERDNPETWVIDQAYGMFGPARLVGNVLHVEDLLEKPPVGTFRSDYREKAFSFIQAIGNDESSLLGQMRSLRENPKLLLFAGQRIDVLKEDTWQSEEPNYVPWFVKYIEAEDDEHRGVLVSRLLFERPGISSRGLECRITLGPHGIEDERVVGYFCDDMVWVDYVDPVPVVNIPARDVGGLVKGLEKIPLAARPVFERELMDQSASGRDKKRIAAARVSFETLRASEEHGAATEEIALAEALYQHAKGNKDYLLSESARDEAMKELRNEHILFREYYKLKRRLRLYQKTLSSVGIKPDAVGFLLDENRREREGMLTYSQLRSAEEKLEEILRSRPTFVDDAVDRMIYAHRNFHPDRDMHTLVEETFGKNYDAAMFRGYLRIFGEFLGHISLVAPQLCLQDYKGKILKKIRS